MSQAQIARHKRMDRKQLIQIAVTAIITFFVREVFNFILRKSKRAARSFRPVMSGFFYMHRKLFPVLWDIITLIILACFFIAFAFDSSPASRRFVIGVVVMIFITFRMLHFTKLDILNYGADLRAKLQKPSDLNPENSNKSITAQKE